MFGIGMPEMLIILAVALIFLGPKKLPDLAKSLGRAMGEFKRATSDLKQSIESETGIDEVRHDIDEMKEDIKAQVDLAGDIPDPTPPPAEESADQPSEGPLDQVKEAFDEMNTDTDETPDDETPDDDSDSQDTQKS